MTFSLCLYKHVIVLTGSIRFLLSGKPPFRFTFGKGLREVMVVPRMESAHIFGKLVHFQIIYIEIEGIDIPVTLILDFNTCSLFKRHGKVARHSGTVSGPDERGNDA